MSVPQHLDPCQTPHAFEVFEGQDKANPETWCRHCNMTRSEAGDLHTATPTHALAQLRKACSAGAITPAAVAQIERTLAQKDALRLSEGKSGGRAPLPPRLVSIDRLGGIRGLQFKRGAGFDLRTMGKAHIVRISEVLWDDHFQGWYVRFMQGELRGELLREFIARDVQVTTAHSRIVEPSGLLVFAEYDDAVAAEIAVVEAARLSGRYKLA